MSYNKTDRYVLDIIFFKMKYSTFKRKMCWFLYTHCQIFKSIHHPICIHEHVHFDPKDLYKFDVVYPFIYSILKCYKAVQLQASINGVN